MLSLFFANKQQQLKIIIKIWHVLLLLCRCCPPTASEEEQWLTAITVNGINNTSAGVENQPHYHHYLCAYLPLGAATATISSSGAGGLAKLISLFWRVCFLLFYFYFFTIYPENVSLCHTRFLFRAEGSTWERKYGRQLLHPTQVTLASFFWMKLLFYTFVSRAVLCGSDSGPDIQQHAIIF